YDSLPEALFHRFSDSRNATGKDMAKESMLLKNEEKQVRKFFRPFENEIFLQRTEVALNENKLFRSLYSDFLNELIPGFWDIDEKIPDKYALKLIRFLPFAAKIAGDLELTAQCLEKVLSEKVNVVLNNEENFPVNLPNSNSEFSGGRLGMSKLGADLVMGQNPTGFIGRLLFKIGPLENTDPKDFFVNGTADLLLNSFIGYFVPAELDVEMKLVSDKETTKFLLGSEQAAETSFLGYNTAL
ncbi:MAG: type VI secretion system baseplate subunit TssG, partial [Prolixibacteraceae bacterium]